MATSTSLKIATIEKWIQERDIKRKHLNAPTNIMTQFAEWYQKENLKEEINDIYQEIKLYSKDENSHLENQEYRELYYQILSKQILYRKLEKKNSNLLHDFIKSIRKSIWVNSIGDEKNLKIDNLDDLINLDHTAFAHLKSSAQHTFSD